MKPTSSPEKNSNGVTLNMKTYWSIPPELLSDTPRHCRPTDSFYRWCAYIPISGLVGFILIACVLGYPLFDLYSMESLHSNGKAVDGYVTSVRETGGKHSARGSHPGYFVEYSYQLAENSLAPQKLVTYHGEGSLDRSYESSAEWRIRKPISIVYDPANPKKSMLASDSRLNEGANIRSNGVAFVVLCIGFTLMFYLWLIFSYRGQKHLLMWGRPAQANIIDMQPHKTKADGWSLTYAFQDGRGKTMKKTILVSALDGASLFERQFESWTVLFDPDDSSKYSLYPLKLVTCVDSP
ncbi:MAG: DUF3592 domain-containing protein [Burkholderiaceae bacterium]